MFVCEHKKLMYINKTAVIMKKWLPSIAGKLKQPYLCIVIQ